MKIAILGSGAMGMLFGGYLSRQNEVVLIDTDRTKVDKINRDGIRIREPEGAVTTACPKAAMPGGGPGEADLVLVFVKAMDTRNALACNRNLIGPRTFVLTLQNGSGHDEVLKEFVPAERIVIGTTRHNSSIIEAGFVRHGGGGTTFIGSKDCSPAALERIRDAFARSGLEIRIAEDIRRKIWEKLFVNASASALTAIFQTNLGFLLRSRPAWDLTEQLIREAVAAANGEGLGFEEEIVIGDVRSLLENAGSGYTSIYADIRDGRKTEVDAISGAVVAAGKRNKVPTPGHEFVVAFIHAMEDKRSC
ncbi:MAG: 2-dehydropantoate 2-reductase [Acidobacteria bacterium]|nr:2-dehydropantoate 2-reductase [Acidobacteriota bacterium]